MSLASPRLPLFAAVLAVGALALVGCSASPGASTPTSTPEQTDTAASGDANAAHAAWLDGGRMIAVVTEGSSTCVPMANDVTAEGQTVKVVLADPTGSPCTKDLVPRATAIGVPEGLDVSKDVEIEITYGEADLTAGLAGLAAGAAAPGSATDYQPSAGWFSDTGVVLLTWGSSTCVPQLQDVAETDGGAKVTFAEPKADQACTLDMAPRATLIELPTKHEAGKDFTLTLTGDNIEGTVQVL
ncbi:MAG: hypothetical protein WA971_02450 [Microbacterium sp.]